MKESHSPHKELVDKIRILLDKFQVEEHLVNAYGSQRHDLETTVLRRQHAVELERKLKALHVADLADLLESLPHRERMLVWSHTQPERRGDVMLELDDAVLERLIESSTESELLSTLQSMDANDLGQLAEVVPEAMLHKALEQRASVERDWVKITSSYPEEQVGHWMSSEMITVQQHQTLASVQLRLAQEKGLPIHTDKLLVTDQRGLLSGALYLQDILLNAPEKTVADVMKHEVVKFHPEDDVEAVGRAFERYDLASAPVINDRGKLVGRLTVDVVMDYVREAAEMDALNVAGVLDSEDLFSGIWHSARNRWLWLGINLISAFAISRIIGAFEGTIAQLVALASLMPIVASVAGNTGNQTTAIVIRSIATEQLHTGNMWHVFRKELGISTLNGVVWGMVVGLFAYVFYQNLSLSIVVTIAMMATFVLAALFGVSAPIVLDKMGKDPAMGSSVILTGVTDALGFMVFLSLASVFLV